MDRLKYTIATSNGLTEITDNVYGNPRYYCGECGTFVLDNGTSVYGKVVKIELLPQQATRS